MNFDDFVNDDWTLFMKFLDDDFSFSELIRQRMSLVDKYKDALSKQSEDHTQQGIKTGSSRGSLCGDAIASHGDNLPAENKFALEKEGEQ